MCVNRCVAGCSSEIFAIFVRNMLPFRVLIALGQAEVNYVNTVLCLFCTSNQEVVWFDVTMDYSFFMHFLNAFDHLNGD